MDENYLDKILGEEGLKTDITVNLKTATYVNLGATIIFSIVVGSLLTGIVSKAFS